MPRVPTVSGPRVESAPLTPGFQPAGAPVEAFGSFQAQATQQLGNVFSQVGDAAGELALRTQIEDNEREAKQLDIEFSKQLRLIGWGDGTEENPGFYTLQGENAVQAAVFTRGAIAEAQKQFMAQASNDRVAEMFAAASAARVNSEFENVTRHTFKQREIANEATSIARQNELIDSAATSYGDIDALISLSTAAANEARERVLQKGLGEEAATSVAQEAATAVYVSAIEGAIAVGEDDVAIDLYGNVKGQMDGRVRAEIETKLKDATIRTRSQELAEKYIAEHPGDVEAQLSAARRELQGLEEDRTVARIKEIDGEFETLKDKKWQDFARARAIEDYEAIGESRAFYERLDPSLPIEERIQQTIEAPLTPIVEAAVLQRLDSEAIRATRAEQVRQARQAQIDRDVENRFIQKLSFLAEHPDQPVPTEEDLLVELESTEASGSTKWKLRGWFNDYIKNRERLTFTDPTLFTDLMRRARDRAITPDELSEFVGQGLSPTHYNFISSFVDKPIDEARTSVIELAEATLTYRSALLPGARDPNGSRRLQQFLVWMIPEWDRRIEAGENPIDLANPEKPGSIASAIERYKRTFSEQLRDMTRELGGEISTSPGLTQEDFSAYETEEDVRDAVQAGTLHPAVGREILVRKFGFDE